MPLRVRSQALDYGRAFLQGKKAENRVRFRIESPTRIIDPDGGPPIDFPPVSATNRLFACEWASIRRTEPVKYCI